MSKKNASKVAELALAKEPKVPTEPKVAEPAEPLKDEQQKPIRIDFQKAAAAAAAEQTSDFAIHIYVKNGHAQQRIVCNVEGISTWEAARIMLLAASTHFGRPAAALLSEDQQEKIARAQQILKDAPALRYYPNAGGLKLCVACDDLYGPHLPGPAVDMPAGMPPVPCDIHMDESKAPCSREDAVKAVTAEPEDAKDLD